MREVVVTGRGLVTPLGVGLEKNELALRRGLSGIRHIPEWKERGLQCQVAGFVTDPVDSPLFDRKTLRHMSESAKFCVAAAGEALAEARIDPASLRGRRVAAIIGCASSALLDMYEGAVKIDSSKTTRKTSPFLVPKVMPSSAVANLSLVLGITGESYDISSACASSAHAIMHALRLLRSGAYEMIITGGAEELSWIQAVGFDAMRALSTGRNDTPEAASRPFDRDRDGFVIAAGAGVLILETAAHAAARGARPIARVSGAAANCNATDMVLPDASASAETMRLALADANLEPGDIGYINTHGTSTPAGDPEELTAIGEVFGKDGRVAINSTKSMTGHTIGAAGALEAIFCTQMLDRRFICPSINFHNPDPGFEWAGIVRETRPAPDLRHCLSNSFGFGGTNAALILSRPA